MKNAPIRIILADDHQLARESWRMLLDLDNRFTVIAECEQGSDAIQKAKESVPDIMIIDINMYPLNGFEITRQVLLNNPAQKVLGISVNNHPSYAEKMIETGAKGYVTKGSSFEEIATALIAINQGFTYICKEIKNLQL